MLIEKRSAPFPFDEVWYVNKENGKEYRQLVGGIGWPSGGKPGFSIVLGEDRKKDENLKRYPIRLLKEYENQNPTDLLKRCNEFKVIMGVTAWYGDSSKASNMEFLRRLKISFSIRNAPYFDDQGAFEFYLNLIRENTSASKKVLFFGKQSKLPGYLTEAPEKRVPLTQAQDYPAIMALGYALSAIIYNIPDWEAEQEYREAEALLDKYLAD